MPQIPLENRKWRHQRVLFSVEASKESPPCKKQKTKTALLRRKQQKNSSPKGTEWGSGCLNVNGRQRHFSATRQRHTDGARGRACVAAGGGRQRGGGGEVVVHKRAKSGGGKQSATRREQKRNTRSADSPGRSSCKMKRNDVGGALKLHSESLAAASPDNREASGEREGSFAKEKKRIM